ncbi:tannase/feruloyl esterase family alpha/beta hydrolase [Sphingomonas kyeonggiensis]|uniref:tannase/feruloyl esterase family alpha/beta hydrolase n=1 Tax=Sphingomonas kyeonggiensis TaxID=1268553 RepID=UPI0027D929B6|nr:tannase/feruloyl esterase family alpha/beta hydrolase [Sphingomonas kyeonggiensis]
MPHSVLSRRLAGGATMILSLALPSLAAAQARPGAPANPIGCEVLSGLRLPDTTITSATMVPKGMAAAALNLPAGADLPAFCRVVAQVRSAPDSDVGVEIWLPVEGWTGVFHGNGNGGFAGTLQAGYGGMLNGLRRGFATATTDTGTAPATMLDGDALIGHPRKWKDWGRLSTHVMTVTGKAVAKAFYGRGARRSYYTGCSTGGQQGLIEALHYPADYDGILVGAPVINRTWGHAAVAWDFAAANRTPGSRLSDIKLGLLNRAAVSECRRQGAALAGDPFVTDPLACDFDPATLLCRGASSDQCLSAAEVATARAFYAGPTTRDGKPAFFGWLPGSEGPGRFGWSFLQSPSNGQPQFASLFKWVFGSSWDWRGFDLDRDMPIVDGALAADVNDATRGNLEAFRARGGKLILYHGLADTLVPPGQTVAFYDRQARALGGVSRLRETARLFLAPGVMHCGGGAGPDSFNSAAAGVPAPPEDSPNDDLFRALMVWREQGKAPERVVATKFESADPKRIAFQRPLCAYPRRTTYAGNGSPRAPGDFACEAGRQVAGSSVKRKR